MVYFCEWYMFIFGQIVGKKFGQFGQNLAKSGHSLEEVSQPRGLHYHFNKYDFLFDVNKILYIPCLKIRFIKKLDVKI